MYSKWMADDFNQKRIPDLLKEYRRLDDSVTMRMNRNTAQFRDRDRMGLGTRGANNQDEACLYFWKELVGMLRHHPPIAINANESHWM